MKRILRSVWILVLAASGAWADDTGTVEPAAVAVAPKPHITLQKPEDREILQQLIDDMVTIPAGSFQMGDSLGVGDDDERPVHSVNIHSFALSRYEVTFEQYDLYARNTGVVAPKDRWGRGRHPVIDVSFDDAMGFIKWLRKVTGLPFRLPSEAEWEYAARAGSDTVYSFGDDPAQICDYANIADASTHIGWRNRKCGDDVETTAPVGSFKPNAFGVYDMYGNVWEWLEDCWYGSYGGAPEDGSARGDTASCRLHAQRGGSWFSSPDEVRSSFRTHGNKLDKSVTLGFRVAYDLQQSPPSATSK